MSIRGALGAILPQAISYYTGLQQLAQSISAEWQTADAAWRAWEGEARAAGVPESRIIELKAPWVAWVQLAQRIGGIDIANEMVRIVNGGVPGNLATFDPPPAPLVPTVTAPGGGGIGGFSTTTLALAAGAAVLFFALSRR